MTLPGVNAVIDCLREGRDTIERGGWRKGELLDRQGRVCALGALAVAAGSAGLEMDWKGKRNVRIRVAEDVEKAAATELTKTLGMTKKGWGDAHLHLQCWNDDRMRTKADVLRLFDRTLDRLERDL